MQTFISKNGKKSLCQCNQEKARGYRENQKGNSHRSKTDVTWELR